MPQTERDRLVVRHLAEDGTAGGGRFSFEAQHGPLKPVITFVERNPVGRQRAPSDTRNADACWHWAIEEFSLPQSQDPPNKERRLERDARVAELGPAAQMPQRLPHR